MIHPPKIVISLAGSPGQRASVCLFSLSGARKEAPGDFAEVLPCIIHSLIHSFLFPSRLGSSCVLACVGPKDPGVPSVHILTLMREANMEACIRRSKAQGPGRPDVHMGE